MKDQTAAASLFSPARLEQALSIAMTDYKSACDDRRKGRATWGDVRETGAHANRLRDVYAERYPAAFNYSAFN